MPDSETQAVERTVLSTGDAANLSRVLGTLLAPLTYPDVPAWQVTVLRELKALLGADMGGFMLPLGDRPPMVSEEIALDTMSRFPAEMQPLDARLSIWRRQVELGVCDRRTLWQPFLDQYLRSAYYNEYIVPARLFDALILNVQLGRRASPDGVAGLWFHHEREMSTPFGDRGVAILRLALPAFRAGVVTVQRLATHRNSLGRTLDATGQPIALFDLAGHSVHRTPPLVWLLAAESRRTELEAALERAAADVARLVARPRSTMVGGYASRHLADHGAGSSTTARRFATSNGVYRIVASLGGPDLGVGEPPILVSVSFEGCAPAASPSLLELADRFGLTPRGAAVALLIAEGLAPTTVASRLGISVHTARRHGEQVFRKLGVHSRAEVGAALRRA